MRGLSRTAALLLAWAVLVAASGIAHARFARPRVVPGDVASIERHLVARIDDAVASRRVGAAALVLLHGGKVAARHAAGVSDPGSRRAVDPAATHFIVASVSKAVTAWGVMRLVDEGRLTLDEPVAPHLTRWRLTGDEDLRTRVSVRHLLSHTAGIEDRAFLSNAQTLEESLAAVRVAWEPGTRMAYSSAGYAILELLVEEITQRSFNDAMTTLVFAPLAMEHSTFDPAVLRRTSAQVAAAYDRELVAQRERHYAAPGSVALFTTADDLARFARAHTIPNEVLRAETLRAMTAPQQATGGSWGLGLTRYATTRDGGLIVGHSGGTLPAWGAMYRVNLRSGNAMILLLSGGSGALNQLPHDWVYWESGTMPEEGRRQRLYDVVAPAGAVFALGALVIVAAGLWRWRSASGSPAMRG
jgi:CubicO group peptidase (beta-lactamase class C family)